MHFQQCGKSCKDWIFYLYFKNMLWGEREWLCDIFSWETGLLCHQLGGVSCSISPWESKFAVWPMVAWQRLDTSPAAPTTTALWIIWRVIYFTAAEKKKSWWSLLWYRMISSTHRVVVVQEVQWWWYATQCLQFDGEVTNSSAVKSKMNAACWHAIR